MDVNFVRERGYVAERETGPPPPGHGLGMSPAARASALVLLVGRGLRSVAPWRPADGARQALPDWRVALPLGAPS
jgi:hypothetical protein